MLSINHLTAGYEPDFFLNDINIHINAGEMIGIIGPNGSGKTTLLKCITRILKILKGEILLEGLNINSMKFKELAQRIAIVSQNIEPGLMTIEEFILLGRIPYFKNTQFFESQNDHDIARRYMKLTGVEKIKNKYMHQISGGEKQLALFTRALVQEPKLLLLDEPISHLDISHQVEILDIIHSLNKKNGLTVMMVLHDLNLAAEYSNRLILMNKGEVTIDDSPEKVLTYKIIEQVYKTIVITKKNPISKKPYVFIISKENLKKQKQ